MVALQHPARVMRAAMAWRILYPLSLLIFTCLVDISDAQPAAKKDDDSSGIVPLCFHGEDAASLGILLILFVLVGSFFAMHMLSACSMDTYVPESIATVGAGLVIGGLMNLLKDPIGLPDISRIFELNTHFFFLILLPAIIFDAGYHMHNQSFFANIGGITLLAVVGTIISTAVIAAGLFFAGDRQLSYPLTVSESLSFGAVISAIDPVATLAIFQALNVNPTLHMLVFGESVVNDAVSITLYRTVQKMGDDVTDIDAIWKGVLSFFWVSIASVLLGAVHGLATSWAYKYVQLHKHINLEVGVYYLMAYIPYLVSDAMGFSPIITVLVVGIFMSEYGHYNLSDAAKITVTNTFRVIAFLSETLVFAYLGLAVFNFQHQFHFDWRLTLWTVFFMVLGRALNVFPLCFVLNLFRREKINFKNQVVMWFSGLRGAIAFALTIDAMNEDESRTGTDRLHVLFTTTLIICVFTIVVFGGGTLPLLRILHVETQEQKSGDVKEKRNAIQIAENAQSRDDYQNQQSWLLRFDNKYLKPMFCMEGWDSAPYQPPLQEMAEGRNPTTPVAIDLVELADVRWGRGSMSIANARDTRTRSSLRLTQRKSYVPNERWHMRPLSTQIELETLKRSGSTSSFSSFKDGAKRASMGPLFPAHGFDESLLITGEAELGGGLSGFGLGAQPKRHTVNLGEGGDGYMRSFKHGAGDGNAAADDGGPGTSRGAVAAISVDGEGRSASSMAKTKSKDVLNRDPGTEQDAGASATADNALEKLQERQEERRKSLTRPIVLRYGPPETLVSGDIMSTLRGAPESPFAKGAPELSGGRDGSGVGAGNMADQSKTGGPDGGL